MLLAELVSTSEAVAATSGRRAKIEAISALLRRAAPAEVPVVVAFLSGELRQRQIGVGYAALGGLLWQSSPGTGGTPGPPAISPADHSAGAGHSAGAAPGAAAGPGARADPTAGADGTGGPASGPLTVLQTDAAFAGIGNVGGVGAQAARRRLLGDLFARASAAERAFLGRLLAGELHQGALEGVMAEAVAVAAGVAAADIRRAHLLAGSLPLVAETALDPSRGLAALRSLGLQVGRPLRPMLASSAPSIAAAMSRVSPAALEWKIDGIRVQVHRKGPGVAVFTRTLDDITARVPEIVAAVLDLDVRAMVLDGEVVALGPGGRPRPFQVTAGRIGSQVDVSRQRAEVPLTPFFFDLLHLDGTDLIDEPASTRQELMSRVLPASLLIPRLVTSDTTAAEQFFAGAVAHGHEGVVVKAASGKYAAGRRGSEWIKVKPRHTLDLVVLAAEWGHGRRRGWLSNLHLGARDPATGGLVMLGKTFKGLTDQMLTWQTGRLLELADPPRSAPAGNLREAHGVLRVRPELVVEVAFDGVQSSPRYPGGLALRFARVLRHRPDKPASEADTIGAVRALWTGTLSAAPERDCPVT